MLEHKEIVFPDVDLTRREPEPEPEPEPEKGESGTAHRRWILRSDHAAYWELIRRNWEETVRKYEEDPSSFARSWNYLNDHPVYWRFHPHALYPVNHVLWLEHCYGFGSDGIPVQVDVRLEGTSRQRTEVTLEGGSWSLLPDEHGNHRHTHDYELDVTTDSYESSVVTLARLVHKRYGNDRRIADESS